MTVTQTPAAQTELGITLAIVILVTMGMDSIAKTLMNAKIIYTIVIKMEFVTIPTVVFSVIVSQAIKVTG